MKFKGGDVRGFVVTAVTGDLGQFMYIDSYPSFSSFALVDRMLTSTPA